MTTITRKTRTVEYFEVDGKEYVSLQEARGAASHGAVCEWLRGSGWTAGNAVELTSYITKYWDQLKAIIEGVRVEDEANTLSASQAVDRMRNGKCVESATGPRYKCRMHGEGVISSAGGAYMSSASWLERYSDARYRPCDWDWCHPTVAAAPAASPESA